MTDPKPIPVSEAREEVEWREKCVAAIKAGLPGDLADAQDGLDKARRILATAQQAERRWVPVSERVPEPYESVLILDSGGNFCEAFYSEPNGVGTWTKNFEREQVDIDYPVPKWMPLPAQPEV